MEITGQGYRVYRDDMSSMVVFEGSLRLSGAKAYSPIAELLHEADEISGDSITLDIRNLKFLNSAGLNMLYKFAFNMGRKGAKTLVVYGSKAVPWHSKVLGNLSRFVERLKIGFT